MDIELKKRLLDELKYIEEQINNDTIEGIVVVGISATGAGKSDYLGAINVNARELSYASQMVAYEAHGIMARMRNGTVSRIKRETN